jgi:D-beta-D-heptose 7-phosphate kinase/D-beta-D-heptose 1-phosphate adenosyltransferase
MRNPQVLNRKIYSLAELRQEIVRWRLFSHTISFTNGCFDILHPGHLATLSAAAEEADFLIVGLNSDASTRRLKGVGRPVLDQDSRSKMLAALLMVDSVIIFDEDTPLELIREILPDVLVKGGDYRIEEIVGAAETLTAGGRVVINPLVPGFSSSALLEKIQRL